MPSIGNWARLPMLLRWFKQPLPSRLFGYNISDHPRSSRAVSQLLWTEKDREALFPWEKTTKRPVAPRISSGRCTWPRTIMCDFLHGKSHVVPRFYQPLPGNPGSVCTNCETALLAMAALHYLRSGRRLHCTLPPAKNLTPGYRTASARDFDPRLSRLRNLK